MKQHRKAYPVAMMASLLHVSVSQFYIWLKHGLSKSAIQRNQQTILVKIAHQETKESYGHIRLTRHLQSQGVKISMYAVRCIKRLNQLYCKCHKRFKRTTNSDHNRSVYNNLLEQHFTRDRPNIAWVSDITFIWTAEGWLYLAALKDLCTKQVVGYNLNERMTAQLVCNALTMVIRNQKPPQGLIVHSDRGSQYSSRDFRALLLTNNCIQSMSRRGNCWDNAVTESFFHTLKGHVVHGSLFATRKELNAVLFDYIEIYYNRVRRHSANDWLSPEAFKQKYFKTLEGSVVHNTV